MKKKLITILAVSIIILSFGLTLIYAQSQEITITANVSIQGDFVNINGIISSGEGEYVTLLVTQHGLDSISDDNIVAIAQKKSQIGGDYSFSFCMPEWADYGTYIAKVGGSDILEPVTVLFAYKPNITESVVKVTDSENIIHEYSYNTDEISVQIGNSGIIEFTNTTYADGPIFAGWYSDKELTIPILNGASVEEGDVIYSKYIGLNNNLKMDDTEIRTTGTLALRFISRISTDFRSEMIALHDDNYAFDPNNEDFNSTSGISYGFIMLPTKFLGGQPMIKGQVYQYGTNSYSPAVIAARSTYALEPGYELYTAALTSVIVANYKQEYSARPYITYKDASGIERTVHGPTTVSTMYDTAKRIIEENTEPEEVIEYLQTNIIDAYDAYISGQTSTTTSISGTSVFENDNINNMLDNDIQDSFYPINTSIIESEYPIIENEIVYSSENNMKNNISVLEQSEGNEISDFVGNESSYIIDRINFIDGEGNLTNRPVSNGKVYSVSATLTDNDSPNGVVIVSSMQKDKLLDVKSVAIANANVNETENYNINLSFGDEYKGLSIGAFIWENFETIRPLSGILSEEYGSSVHISTIEDSNYIFSVNDSGISDFENIVYTVEYDASVLELVDCVANTPVVETVAGTYGNIIITEVGEGFVKFKTNTVVPEGKKWSGVVNRLKFIATDAVDTYIYVSK